MRRRALWYGITAAWVAAGCAVPPPQAEPGRRPTDAGGTFEPIVLPDSIVGRVVDDTQHPIAGATVTLFLDWTEAELRRFSGQTLLRGWDLPPEERGNPLAVRVTPASGAYAFHALEDGWYTLRVIAPGYAFTEREVYLSAAGGG